MWSERRDCKFRNIITISNHPAAVHRTRRNKNQTPTMSNIHIDTTEKDAVRIVLSAHAGTLDTAIHMFRSIYKHNPGATVQLETTVETACELEDNAVTEITATKPSADAQSFRDSITEVSRNIIYPFIIFLDENSLVQSDENEKVNILLKCMKECCDEIPSSDPIRSLASTSRAGEIAIKALWILLIRHHAADPIRNIPAFSMAIMNRIVNLLVKKNHDYGNSFGDQLAEDGPIVFKIRMKDKISRLRTLLTPVSPSEAAPQSQVKDESIEDTLRDIIGYCILFIHHTK